MSAIYHTEPPTLGKVLLKTSFGDIDIELWSKEAPLACRNFIQLALEGYYDNTIVHRVIKGFMVQMGDPSGTGRGGQSIWKGRPFKDEIHGRLKFNHRGQVAMANENAPNTNQSQFFVTLDACEWLNRKHTIFGKVTGNTIFNVLRVGDVEVEGGEGGDRPLEELRILGIEVLANPFDDIVPRDLSLKKNDNAATAVDSTNTSKNASSARNAKAKLKAVKDKKLLSFGDDEEEEEVEGEGEGGEEAAAGIGSRSSRRGMHSSHDSKFRDKKLSSNVSASLREEVGMHPSAVAAENDRSSSSSSSSERGKQAQAAEFDVTVSAADFDRSMRERVMKGRDNQGAKEKREKETTAGITTGTAPLSADDDDGAPPLEPEQRQGALPDADTMAKMMLEGERNRALKTKHEQFKQLREDLIRSKRAVNVLTGAEAEQVREEASEKELVSALEQRRRKFIKRKNEHGDRGEDTMKKLMLFTDNIRKKQRQQQKDDNTTSISNSNDDRVAAAEGYHGQVLEADDAVAEVALRIEEKGGVLQTSDTASIIEAAAEREKLELQNWFVGKLKCKKHIDDQYRHKEGTGGSSASRASSSSSSSSAADGRYVNDYTVFDPRKQ